MADRIELLAPALLEENRMVVDHVRDQARSLRLNLGWHYVMDIAWLLRELPLRPNLTVLDAGAGVGIMQWLLADQGIDVMSIDRLDRSRLSVRFRLRYPIDGLEPGDLGPVAMSILADLRSGAAVVDARRNAGAVLEKWRGKGPRDQGTVTIHRGDLASLGAIGTASVDHVVAVSALEHNDLSRMPDVVAELWRVLRPGGSLAVTVGASSGEDWFHAPSRGWCFSEATLKRIFGLPPALTSNYSRYEEILEATRSSQELRDNLAPLYRRSGDNGMPWGRWDPTYLSVGVRRDKPNH